LIEGELGEQFSTPTCSAAAAAAADDDDDDDDEMQDFGTLWLLLGQLFKQWNLLLVMQHAP